MVLKEEVSREDLCKHNTKFILKDTQLNKLDFALRTIGSSGQAIHAVYCLKKGIRMLRDLYGINTALLFPSDRNVKIYRGMSVLLIIDTYTHA